MEVPEHYQQGTAAGLLPINKPQTYITGLSDVAVPPAIAAQFLALARAKADERFVKAIDVEGVGHHEYNDPRHKIFSEINKQISAIFNLSP